MIKLSVLKHRWNMKSITCGLLFLFFSTAALSQPQREKIDFDHSWLFHLGNVPGARFSSFKSENWRRVNLPHDWSIEQPFDAVNASGQAYLPGGIGWYRKTFTLPKRLKGKIVKILFDGAYDDSNVWINGHYLGNRPYGFISFYYDLTPYLRFDGAKNVISVEVNHSHDTDSRWYTGSGINRNVWLEVMKPVHVAQWGTFVRTPSVSKEAAEVDVVTEVVNQKGGEQTVRLRTNVEGPAGQFVAHDEKVVKLPAHSHRHVQQTLNIKNPSLWSIQTPNLYTLHSAVQYGGETADVMTTPFGVRTFRFDAKTGFFLNGKSMLIKGICLHNDAGALGSAVPIEEWKRRLKLMKEMGANAIRTSHNPPAPALLDLADRMGFLVMDEAFDEWQLGKKKWKHGRNVGQDLGAAGLKKFYSQHGYSDFFENWAKQDIQDMVRRDRNHPSVILWSIGNEIDYPNDPYTDPTRKPYQYDASHPEPAGYQAWRPAAYHITEIARHLYDDVKEVDPTRPVTAAIANAPLANKTGYSSVLDVAGYNYQEKYYEIDHKEFPTRKLIGSENGDSYRAWLAVKNNAFVPGQFLWTGIDYLGEAGRYPNHASGSGLVTLNDYRKPGYYFRKSLWTEKPMVYLAVAEPAENSNAAYRKVASNWTWRHRGGQKLEVLAYTNAASVKLFLNNKSLGAKKLADTDDHVLRWDVPYQPGTLRAVARNYGKEVARYELKTAGRPSKIILRCNCSTIASDGKDTASIKVLVTDRNRVVVPDADNMIHFKVSGVGTNIGVGNDDYNSVRSYKANERKVSNGKARIIIQSKKRKGDIHVIASSANLTSAKITIKAR